MRCIYCNVDLEDTRENCPLCGKPAAKEKQIISHVTVPYPKYSNGKLDGNDKLKKQKK